MTQIKIKNEYVIKKDVVHIKIIHEGKECVCLVSLKDLPTLKDGRISVISGQDKRKYVRLSFGRHRFLLSRFIMKPERNKMVDHINHNTFDNRQSNLRFATPQENQQNRKGASILSKSGIRNVCWDKNAGKWSVGIRKNKVKYYYGLFDDVKKAERVAIMKRRELLGVFGGGD